MPVAAYTGPRSLMEQVAPLGPVYQAGTLSGNPIATAAGIAMLTALRDDSPYEQLEVLSARLERGLKGACEVVGIPYSINRVGSMMTLFFSDEAIVDWETAATCDTERFAKYFWAMIERGVYMPCSQFEALFVSATHRDKEIDATIAAAAEVIQGLASST